jgi:hypothetical protein
MAVNRPTRWSATLSVQPDRGRNVRNGTPEPVMFDLTCYDSLCTSPASWFHL